MLAKICKALNILRAARIRGCAEKAHGEVAEWSIVLDSKSSELKGSEGSNPSLSAKTLNNLHITLERFSQS